MNKLKTLVILALLVPQLAFGATAVGWSTPTITTGWIMPNMVNGVNQAINAIAGIFTSASSTFAGPVRMPSLADGCLQLASSVITSTGSNCGSSSGNNFAFPFDVNVGYNSTSTTIGFFGGLFSTASSSFSGPFRFPSLSQGALYVGSNSLVNTTATGTVSAGTGISVTPGQSVFGSGLTITNDGVTSISGTAPIVNNLSTGAVALSCPTCIVTGTRDWFVNGLFLTPTTSIKTFINQSTSTLFSANFGEFGATATTTLTLDGKVGVGTTSPAARLAVNSVAGDNFSLWVGSTTLPWLRVSNSGFGTTTLSGLNILGFATSTSNVGWNITTGCYSINSVCIQSASGALFSYDAWTHPLLGLSASTSQFILGTSTASNYGLTVATSTAPQLALSAGAGIQQWTFRNAGGNLYVATTSTAGTSTSTPSAFSIVGPLANVGIGTDNPTEVNANSRLTVAGIGSQDIIASTTDNTTLSDAIFNAYAPGSRVFLGAHGTNQVSTRYGITLGGWGELGAFNSSFGTTNGLIVGTNPAVPLVFGTGNLERARYMGTGALGIGTTTPFGIYTTTISSSTASQLSLSAGAGLAQWFQRNAGGNFYLGTTTVAGTATSSVASISIIGTSGNIGIATSTPTSLLQLFSTGTSTLSLDSNSTTKGSCIEMKDRDGSGYTYLYANNGQLFSTTTSCK